MVSTLLKFAVVATVLGVAWRWYEKSQRLPPVADGFYQPEYKPVAKLFRKFVEDGTERGASFAVYQGGKPLIEMWGGYADPESRRPWQKDTVTNVHSVTKAVSAAALAKLVERGLMDYKKEVREYWPEFAVNGKSNITVEMLLSHQGGLATLGGVSFTLHDYKYDWKRVEKLLSSAAPEFPPGSKVGYHTATFGMYVDALIRRVDPKHRNLSQFFDEEIAKPYGIDFYMGLPKELYYRAARAKGATVFEHVALLLDPRHRAFTWGEMMSSKSYFMRGAKVSIHDQDVRLQNNPEESSVGVGSYNGYGNAGSLAKLFDYLSNGGTIGDETLLPRNIVEKFSVSLTDSLPSALSGNGLRSMSLGFMVEKDSLGTRFGHIGFGGQQAWADPKNKLAMAYVTNFNWPHVITPSPHYEELVHLFYACYDHKKAKVNKN